MYKGLQEQGHPYLLEMTIRRRELRELKFQVKLSFVMVK
jgi:hypothetical protein